MSDTSTAKESANSSQRLEKQTSGPSRQLEEQMAHILVKLKESPCSITTEDARRLSENYQVHDERSARIISAVEAFAQANEQLHEQDANLGQAPHTSILTVVKDLRAAVNANPDDITIEVLQTTQEIVGKMQESIGHSNAPNPEIEAELQEDIARIEPKIAQGTVTKAEADHLHSLEARAHGHTVKGGITAIAQSIAAKRERQLSLGSDSSRGFPARKEEPHHATELDIHKTGLNIMSNNEQDMISDADSNVLHPRKMLTHGYTEKGDPVAMAQILVARKRRDSLSDRSNVSPRPSEADHERCKEMNLKFAETRFEPKVKEATKNVTQENAAHHNSDEHRAYSQADKGDFAS